MSFIDGSKIRTFGPKPAGPLEGTAGTGTVVGETAGARLVAGVVPAVAGAGAVSDAGWGAGVEAAAGDEAAPVGAVTPGVGSAAGAVLRRRLVAGTIAILMEPSGNANRIVTFPFAFTPRKISTA
jgi:hypothetical protein